LRSLIESFDISPMSPFLQLPFKTMHRITRFFAVALARTLTACFLPFFRSYARHPFFRPGLIVSRGPLFSCLPRYRAFFRSFSFSSACPWSASLFFFLLSVILFLRTFLTMDFWAGRDEFTVPRFYRGARCVMSLLFLLRLVSVLGFSRPRRFFFSLLRLARQESLKTTSAPATRF